ncbi:MAG TPA: hypothetical protein VL244_02110 [Alphaproteobacteria bacterium]|nr:hypothetical protein [Alphaproteobacteria bacterium]
MTYPDLHLGPIDRPGAAARLVPQAARREGAALRSVMPTITAFALLAAMLLAGIVLRLWLYFSATAPLHS